MKPIDMQLAIAEACGRKPPFSMRSEWFEDGDSDGWVDVWRDADGFSVPNYPGDLNAMARAEKTLSQVDICQYRDTIRWVCNRDYRLDKTPTAFAEIATALQRAEAYLRVKGLWRES